MWCLKTTIIFLLYRFIAAQNIGDFCSLTTGGGTCKSIYDCPSAIALLKQRIRPVTCGFENQLPIVCCPLETTPETKKRPVGQISKEKCSEYAKSVYVVIRPPILIAGAATVNTSTCAQTNIPLVIGGEKSKLAEFPHQALLGYGEGKDISWQCGGTLISENFVVTAAHCLVNGNREDISVVRLGELDYGTRYDNAETQDFKVAEVIKHPDRKPPLRYHDIALLKLDRNVKFTKFVRPACLQTDFEIPLGNFTRRRFIATGWGKTEKGSVSKHLLKVVLDHYYHDECKTTFEKVSTRFLDHGIDERSQICAGGTDVEKDTCQGDSGGPLQIYNKEVYCMYNLIGITSFGKECGVPDVPAVYTRVSNYIEWIENTVWPQ